ncbi:MAG: DUF3325 family protein [Pseudomonadota bacterium]
MGDSIAAIGLTYLACVLLFQASERRTQLAGVKQSANLQHLMRFGAGGLLILTLCLFALQSGLEFGLPIWLGVLSAAGGLSLLVSALYPRWHLKSAAVVVLACAALIALAMISGGQQ